ncbi:Por secretion system C-terminal sorting domain-containing protein [Cyclonatronum proteinivorum]|uniref:Por secretion system C-terminal sorting domain-containing protein n=2 Tax=Cyclonatronum proteinivorum TaxID=1457365 RepID=A0A345UNE0_9BACT|nr:Por secretion system C-terminal sorting domain-containing protein [Cyclonatronum proteinivorum]
MKKWSRVLGSCMLAAIFGFAEAGAQQAEVPQQENPPIYIAFHWHMHQPIYWPYESVVETEARGAYSFSLKEVHTSRTGPYTTWPANAVQKGISAGMPHFGAQVSFSGSLIENLEAARQAGWGFQNWRAPWLGAIAQQTSMGNPRIDMTGFGYHHPLMALTDYDDIRRQIQWHREIMAEYFPGEYSRGIFPPETAFSPRIIPALVDEGFEWVIVDNLHFERASEGAPLGDASGVKRPNRADVRNPNPGDWQQLSGLWAPTPVSMQWAHQPRFVSFTNPETGEESRIIAVPASRYLGEEDGRGGFGALQYEHVMSQFEAFNTDPNHPILLVLHHDGDNHGGGSESYYNHNFQNMVNWLQQNPERFVVTTIQDYLDRYPPNPSDVIHVQDGSWLGADAGDPEFKKWLGDPGSYPGADGPYSPDRNSWGVMTAAQNFVRTAAQINPNHPDTRRAWEFYLNGQASDYWYWDGTEMWDSHPSRAANQAVEKALSVVQNGPDQTPPSIFLPQRTPYNPGGIEWDSQGVMPSDFDIWTYVFDLSGLDYVHLRYRVSESPGISNANLTFAGGAGVGEWETLEMSGTFIPSITNPVPLHKAEEFRATITGLSEVMVDYYVEAADVHGNVSRSLIQHVWVGQTQGGGPGPGPDPDGPIVIEPAQPSVDDVITLTITNAPTTGRLHWGVNTWNQPIEAYWPDGTFLFGGTGPAVQTPLTQLDDGSLQLQFGPFNNPAQEVQNISFVINYDNDSWDNNNGQDYFISIAVPTATEPVSENPLAFRLHQNYPNPFNPVTVISYQLPEAAEVSLEVFNLQGQRVATLIADEHRHAGTHQHHFDGSSLSSGIYLYRLRAGSYTETRKMTLLK